jgi:hypothetical protein
VQVNAGTPNSHGVDSPWYIDTGATDHITGELEKLAKKSTIDQALSMLVIWCPCVGCFFPPVFPCFIWCSPNWLLLYWEQFYVSDNSVGYWCNENSYQLQSKFFLLKLRCNLFENPVQPDLVSLHCADVLGHPQCVAKSGFIFDFWLLKLVPYTVRIVLNLEKERTGATSYFDAKFHPCHKILYLLQLSTSKPDVGWREQLCSMLVLYWDPHYSYLAMELVLYTVGCLPNYSNAKYCYASDLAMATLWMPLLMANLSCFRNNKSLSFFR